MSQHDELPLRSFLQEELALTLTDILAHSIVGLPPIVRLRLLAFLHLIEERTALSAELDFAASGDLRLTLMARQRSRDRDAAAGGAAGQSGTTLGSPAFAPVK